MYLKYIDNTFIDLLLKQNTALLEWTPQSVTSDAALDNTLQFNSYQSCIRYKRHNTMKKYNSNTNINNINSKGMNKYQIR